MTPSETLLQYFGYTHLPVQLQAISEPCARLALAMEALLPDGPEKTAGLRRLLEAKDCFVRANLETPRPWWQTTDLTEVPAKLTDVSVAYEKVKAETPTVITGDAQAVDEHTDAEYLKDGRCFGPTKVEEDGPNGWNTAVCYRGLCTWSLAYPPGAYGFDELKRKHHESQSPLTGKNA